jgi:pimeloyl-ACP methyl ester carboxylesterase
MKIFLLFLCFIMQAGAWSQHLITIDSGYIDQVEYKILIPPHWDHKLVMFAHGYEFMGAPPQIKASSFVSRVQPFLDRGFAVAASAYGIQGFSMPVGVDDNESLRKFFFKKYGKPDTTIMVGQSLGGGVAMATMEHFGKRYDGALGLCSFSSRPYIQCRKEFDLYATFNVLFPGVVPSLSNVMDIHVPYQAINPREIGSKAQKITAGFMKDSVLATAFAKRFDLKVTDLAMSLMFNENVLRDVAQKSGGNPFDNTNTIYTGFPNDFEMNQKVERLVATADANKIFDKYDRTGNIDKPVLLMHTIYDQLIPPTLGEVNFENMVHKQGKDKYLSVKYTNGQAHCAFTPAQIGTAFDELRNWIHTGRKASPGFID